MRIVMYYTWKGIAGGTKGKVLGGGKLSGKEGTYLKVKFDNGETHEVPQAATISEIVYNQRNLEPMS